MSALDHARGNPLMSYREWRTADPLAPLRPFLALSPWGKARFILSPNLNASPGMSLFVLVIEWGVYIWRLAVVPIR